MLAFAFDSFVAVSMSRTVDEGNHIDYGKRILQFQSSRLGIPDDSKMPVSALNAIPAGVAKILDNHHRAPALVSWLRSLYAARLATILATLLLGFYVYLWVRELYGPTPALVSAVLIALSPNIVAHGTVATTDLYFSLGTVASLYYFRRYLLAPTLQRACCSGAVLAVAQLSKSFAVHLYGVIGCFLLVFYVTRFQPSRLAFLTGKRIAAYASLALIFFIAVINLGFCFNRSFTRLGDYRFESVSFKRLQKVPVLRSVPIPFPYPFLQGLDMMKSNEQTGINFGNIYLLGNLRRSEDVSFHGFKSYYAVALFFKEAIPLQIFFVIGLIWIVRNRSLHDFLSGEALLLSSAVILLIWLSLFNRAQIGIRQILPFFAIDVIVGSAAFVGFNSKTGLRQSFLCALVLWLGASVASYYPHMIPYMNEWVLDRKMAYKIVADSNLDWKQNAGEVGDFLKNNPDVRSNPTTPVAGRILVDANLLVGVPRHAPDQMFWLRSRYKPVAHVGYADFLFVVPESDLPNDAGHK
jgi:4-amino-4-deoxy-L-arabinose transferase-like glycosyltransferase